MENTANTPELRQASAHYVVSLAERRDYAGVVKYYEGIGRELGEWEPSEAGVVIFEAAKAYAALSNYDAALKAARTAQSVIASFGDGPLLAETFLTLAKVLRNLGELKESEKACRDAESIFRRHDCLDGQCRAMNRLAGLFYQQADYHGALKLLLDAIEIARRLDDKRQLAYMLGNVGRIQTFFGSFADARKHLELSIDLSEQLSDYKEVARAQMALGYMYIQLGEYGKAETSLDSVSQHLAALTDQRDEVYYHTYRGELYYRTNRMPEATRELNRAMQLADEVASGTSLAGTVLRHLAELEIRLNRFASAQRHAAAALSMLEGANSKVEAGTVWKIKAQTAEALGRKSEARQAFSRALEILRESGVRFEEAEALMVVGGSNLFSAKERLAFLFRAEEYFRCCGQHTRANGAEDIIGSLGLPVPDEAAQRVPSMKKENQPAVSRFLTNCPEILEFIRQLPDVGRSDLPLWLTGETGVGKDHMARYFHETVRPGRPFVAVNCAAVPETLLESELFGHLRGAFTGADADKPGLFVAANGGTLYLDEICDMPLSLQAKLLSVLGTRRLIPLGSTREIVLDVRLVVASNKELAAMVESGDFRRDLYYRLCGLCFHIRPLRERKEDIPLLLEHFMAQCRLLNGNGDLPAELLRQFIEYDWPGNVRELHNKVRRLQIMASMVTEGDLAVLARSLFPADAPPSNGSLFKRVADLERKLLVETLLAEKGNKSRAARRLEIDEA
ncbi:MAG TPA: sigma 54-interacting transcriptional regulator, partial [Candidatus Deferrimicrobium sp.]|nr:sigma 54-interacting transcriptional regulator [Candidatus Deferrimicrobium sp.]